MYEITWVDSHEFFNVRTQNYRAAEALYFSLDLKAWPRLWQWVDGQVRLLSGRN